MRAWGRQIAAAVCLAAAVVCGIAGRMTALYLPEIGAERAGFAFAASLVALAVPLLLFFAGSEYLEQGIAASGVSQTPVKGIGKGAEDESFLL